MKWVTLDNLREWLDNNQLIYDPYLNNPSDGVVRATYRLPERYLTIESFMRCLLTEAVDNEDIAFELYDRFPSEPARDIVLFSLLDELSFKVIYKEKNKSKLEITCVARSEEIENIVVMFALSCVFGWKAYIYAKKPAITFFNWEGEFLDIWSGCSSAFKEANQLAKAFEFECK